MCFADPYINHQFYQSGKETIYVYRLIQTQEMKMTEEVKQIQSQEMSKVGMAFMGFIMGVGSIVGIWFVAGLVQVLNKMMG